MNDITMCTSKQCPQRNICFRAQAEADQYQSYSDFYDPNRKTCEYFWKWIEEEN